jgi:hypothetical protein
LQEGTFRFIGEEDQEGVCLGLDGVWAPRRGGSAGAPWGPRPRVVWRKSGSHIVLWQPCHNITIQNSIFYQPAVPNAIGFFEAP